MSDVHDVENTMACAMLFGPGAVGGAVYGLLVPGVTWGTACGIGMAVNCGAVTACLLLNCICNGGRSWNSTQVSLENIKEFNELIGGEEGAKALSANSLSPEDQEKIRGLLGKVASGELALKVTNVDMRDIKKVCPDGVDRVTALSPEQLEIVTGRGIESEVMDDRNPGKKFSPKNPNDGVRSLVQEKFDAVKASGGRTTR